MVEVTLPLTSDEFEESLIVFWNVQEGDRVEEGDLLLEVQTEKAIFEIEAESSGIIKQILIKRGESAKVGDVLAVIEPAGAENPGIVSDTSPPAEIAVTQSVIEEQRSSFVSTSPRLRHLAKELNVDLSLVNGTGPNGCLTEQDILRAASGVKDTLPETRITLMTGIRRTIAKRMMDSLHQSAQLTETTWADVTALSKRRKEAGSKVSWNDIVLYTAVKALTEHSALNAHVQEESILQFEEVHLGIAVDTENGLVVPVVRNADGLTIIELHEEVNRLVEKTKAGSLSHAEMSGSTFTVTNLGAYGIQFYTPILNPPEAAILGVGKIETYLALEEGKVVQKERLPLSLTFDHRAIDGAPAARFLKSLVKRLENPEQTLF